MTADSPTDPLPDLGAAFNEARWLGLALAADRDEVHLRFDVFTLWSGSGDHVLDVFQDGSDTARHLDVRIWFGRMRVFGIDGGEIPLDSFAAGGTRWWDGLRRGDPRTQGYGVLPLRES